MMISFLDTWQKLNEIYDVIDFNDPAVSKENYYHFYTSLYDLANSIIQGRIYSDKNIGKETQHDYYATNGEAYVCMTTELEGKKWLVQHYNRPFGISFNKSRLQQLCRQKGYKFDTKKAYSQFKEKTRYTTAKRGDRTKPVFNNPKFSDFEIFAIGQLEDGRYFISAGQGPLSLWDAQVFSQNDKNTADKTYQTLRNWFMQNMTSGNINDTHFYYFKDSNIGEPLVTYKGIPIKVSGNLNKAYEPRPDTDKQRNRYIINSDDVEVLDPAVPSRYADAIKNHTYESTIAFNIDTSKCKFKELIGIGPVALYNDKGELILDISYVNRGTQHGYKGPSLFGLDQNSGVVETDTLVPGRAYEGSQQINLLASADTINMLSSLYDEHEYRLYIPGGRDMRFDPKDIATIIVPEYYKVNNIDNLDLVMLASRVCTTGDNQTYDIQLDNETLAAQLIADKVIFSEAKKASSISNETLKLFRAVYRIFHDLCPNANVEFLGDHKVTNQAALFKLRFNKNEDNLDDLPDKPKAGVHIRYLLNNVWPDYSKPFENIKWRDDPSVLGYVNIGKLGLVKARLGAQTIITGYDVDGKKYVLFVNNAHKAANFPELPGGGLYIKPSGPQDFIDVAKQRLDFKGGLLEKDISNFVDTGKALLLHEDGVAQDKEVSWSWSYYRLYKAHYNKIITEDEYTRDNMAMAKELNVKGYVAYLRWIPVEDININSGIVSRYSNIIKMIREN